MPTPVFKGKTEGSIDNGWPQDGDKTGLLSYRQLQREETSEDEQTSAILERIEALDNQELDVRMRLKDLDSLFAARRQPFLIEIEEISRKLEEERDRLHLIEEKRQNAGREPAPGPKGLSFVEDSAFSIVCSVIIFANLVCMVLEIRFPQSKGEAVTILDNTFLLWYCVELSLKAVYLQRKLLVGKLIVVWWNWLDLCIVVSGILDQWIMPMFGGTHGPFDPRMLRALRFLRLFRLARVLKIARSFLLSDLSWTESSKFEGFIMCVIAVNALIMGLELDYAYWHGWFWIEQVLLIIYFFELTAKLKAWGCHFFYAQQWIWHWLDFIIVGLGVIEQWMFPAIVLVTSLVTGKPSSLGGPLVHRILGMLRLFRLLRILRLVHIFRGIRPLYRLAKGVQEALHGMQWVMVLTVVLLYVGSIVFTNLVGHGIIYGGHDAVPEEASLHFGTCMSSMFSLFKLMNDDQSVVDPIVSSIVGKLLFAFFMVASNWMILAVLTSVVSDHMINASTRELLKDEKAEMLAEQEQKGRRLKACFKERDIDESGIIAKSDFKALMDDEGLCRELCDASELTVPDLKDIYFCVCDQEHNIHYNEFVEELHAQGENADKRSIFRIMALMRDQETRQEKRHSELMKMLLSSKDERIDNQERRSAAAKAHAFATNKKSRSSFIHQTFEDLFSESLHRQEETPRDAAADADGTQSSPPTLAAPSPQKAVSSAGEASSKTV